MMTLDYRFIQKVGCGLLICANDKYATILQANAAFYKMIGYEKAEFKQKFKNRFSLLIQEDVNEILVKVMKCIVDDGVLDYEFHLKRKDGEFILVHNISKYNPEKNCFCIALMDITKKENALDELSQIANTDDLTQVLNRSAFEERVAELISQTNESSQHSLLLIDIDNFKRINDVYGHPVGDKILKRVGKVLNTIQDDTCAVGRLGGDEFLIYLSGIENNEGLKQYANKIAKWLCDANEDIGVTVSVGAVMHQGEINFKTLYKNADVALYSAKKRGRNGAVVKEI